VCLHHIILLTGGLPHVYTVKLKKYRTRDTACIYMLSLKLTTNTKMNLVYLSNIQNAKCSDSIRFVPYFNRQNHVKDKKISFKLDIVCPTSIVRVLVSDTYHTRDTPFTRRVRAS